MGRGVVSRFLLPIAFLIALLWFKPWLLFMGGPASNALSAREIALKGLGEFLNQKFPQETVLVVSNPFVAKSDVTSGIREMEAAALRGLAATIPKMVVDHAPL